jgi:arylsulfatase A-like enzyme
MNCKFISLLVGALFSCSSVANAQRKPNILIIVSDDHAYQAIGAYGSKLMHTPNIDRIAKEGVLFKKAYVTNSICGPSRAVILTGKYSHKNGFYDNNNPLFDGSQNTFIKELRSGGYQTAWVGKWHLGSAPQGFDYWQVLPDQGNYYNPDFLMMDGTKKRIEGYVSNLTEDIAENWLDGRDTAKPFCLVIGHKATHRSWFPDTTDMGKFDSVNFPLPHDFYDSYNSRSAAEVQDMTIDKTMEMGLDLKMLGNNKTGDPTVSRMNAAQREKFDAYYQPIEADFNLKKLSGNALVEWKFQRYMKDYLSTAASLDRNVGRVLNYLDSHHLTNNTLVIYLSDQGFYLGEHGWFDKRFMYEESFRTPLLIRYPGVVKRGTQSNDFVMNLDIASTVLDAAGLKSPKDIQGESILPMLQNAANKGRQEMYYHYYENGIHAVSPHFGIKTKRYKLIRFYEKVAAWELFDLQNDPHELKNLYGKKGVENITLALTKQLKALIKKYEDVDAEIILSKGVK